MEWTPADEMRMIAACRASRGAASVAQLDRVLPSEAVIIGLRSSEASGQIGLCNKYAPVAQLDRVLPSEGKGRGFESRQVRHISLIYKPFP